MKKILSLVLCMGLLTLTAQEYFPNNKKVSETDQQIIAFTEATIVTSPQNKIENGTLLIAEHKVLAVGKNISIPPNATVINLKGKFIYPSFIDIYAGFGIKKPQRKHSDKIQYDASRTGYYWNDHIMPEQNALDQFKYDSKSATPLLEQGFAVVNTHIPNGIARGTGMTVALNNEAGNETRILNDKSTQHFSFSKSVTSNQVYPTSLMGGMALLRQMYLDASWYENGNAKNKDLSLEALNRNKGKVQIFESGSRANILRAFKIAKELNKSYIYLGGGDEFERVEEIKAAQASLIIPLKFRKAYDVSNPMSTDLLTLADMKKWNQEPYNLKLLADHGIKFALTTHGLKDVKSFTKNLNKAIASGFDKSKALAALTTIPAEFLGMQNQIGSLKKGAWANLIICSGEIFDQKTMIYENWVQGTPYRIHSLDKIPLDGTYEMLLEGKKYKLTFSEKSGKTQTTIKKDSVKLSQNSTYKSNWLNLTFLNAESKYTRLIAKVENPSQIQGTAVLGNGNEVPFVARLAPSEKKDKASPKKEKDKPQMIPISYPNMAYGVSQMPAKETILFKNATLWTNEKEGVIENADLLVKDGKITKIGKNLKASNARIIDATGKHITPGIIDEHTHIAATSINEAGHNSSAEVSITDVIDETDIAIYRNLAGGVTAAQILHGSANPIGGQSALIKLKWGAPASEILIPNAPKFIKFALGENVKQSNWGSNNTVRFPQTRMGVEQVYEDYFSRALAYAEEKKSGKAYRKDLEMETLLEIINKNRFISCHSYVQSEINMLMKVAERFGFRINTFTHILEGYKVADKMKSHGVGGSTFSDWWAYKYEVNDAIPYNASIMQKVGITTAINSDDSEMSRRLNQEAAKTVKYGGVSEEEALKMVTLNPAILLHLDDKVGSLKKGKDADIVLWNHHPLSVYSKPEITMIEGAIYFDLKKDKEARTQIQNQRNQLIHLMLQEKIKGAPTQKPKTKERHQLHCDSMEENL